MTVRLIAGLVVGAILGGIVGYFGQCRGGSCPITCTPVGGIIFGALFGALIASSWKPGGSAVVTEPSPHLIEVVSEKQLQELLAASPVVLVDFYADWCGPCRKLKPTIHELADTYQGRVAVAGVNVDNVRALAEAHLVSGIPDVRIFRGGEEKTKLVGLQPKAKYIAALDELLQ